MSDMRCARDTDIDHHLHDLLPNEPRYPARVCCRCGDVFEPVDDDWPCGEFVPTLRDDTGGEMPRRSGT